MPWVFIEPEYTGPKETCRTCDGHRVIMYSNPPSPGDMCTMCDGNGWIPCEDEPLGEMDAVEADEGEG